MLIAAAKSGIGMVEFGCGNWSAAPHLPLDSLLDSRAARRDFLARLHDHGLVLSALNCSGNPLHPGQSGRAHRDVTSRTLRLAGLLGVERVVMSPAAQAVPVTRTPTGSRPPGHPSAPAFWHGSGSRF
jgi:sugar phosphate isomerase/epimerase